LNRTYKAYKTYSTIETAGSVDKDAVREKEFEAIMDPTLTMERLTYALESRFKDLIDMSDRQSDPPDEYKSRF